MVTKPVVGSGVKITGGTVNTGGGDIVGGDKVQFISGKNIAGVFDPVARAIEGAEHHAAAEEKLRALKDEAAKGKNADDSVIAKLVEGLIGFAPGAVAAIVGAFASPVLNGIAGPITKYVLEKYQTK